MSRCAQLESRHAQSIVQANHEVADTRHDISPRMRQIVRLFLDPAILAHGIDILAEKGLCGRGTPLTVNVQRGRHIRAESEKLVHNRPTVFARPAPLVPWEDAEPAEHFRVTQLIALGFHGLDLLTRRVTEVLKAGGMVGKPAIRLGNHFSGKVSRGLLGADHFFQEEQAVLAVNLRKEAGGRMPAEVPCAIDDFP